MIDKRVRDDFIGLDKMIFFNNASWAPMLKAVKQRIEEYLQEICNLNQPDEQSMAYLDQARAEAAKMVGAEVAEIGFAFNTSCGINLAAAGLSFQPGDEIILPDNEFPTAVYPFKFLEEEGVALKYSPSVNDNFSLDEARKLITPRTRLLAISFVQYFNGFRNDLKAIGELCKEHDIYFVVDGMQGLGVCPLNVHECHIDLMACGGQKWLLAPLGSGFFFLSNRAKRPLKSRSTGWLGVDWQMKFTDLRHFDREPFADARRFNLGTYPYLQLWALEEALRYLNNLGVDNIFAHNLSLIDRLLAHVQHDDFYQVRSSLEPKHRSQILSLGSPAGDQLRQYLSEQGIFTVYREGGVRVAVNFYNTAEEIDVLIDRLQQFKAGWGR
jgi:selenocysteine lyase/cysteine desulfurase